MSRALLAPEAPCLGLSRNNNAILISTQSLSSKTRTQQTLSSTRNFLRIDNKGMNEERTFDYACAQARFGQKEGVRRLPFESREKEGRKDRRLLRLWKSHEQYQVLRIPGHSVSSTLHSLSASACCWTAKHAYEKALMTDPGLHCAALFRFLCSHRHESCGHRARLTC